MREGKEEQFEDKKSKERSRHKRPSSVRGIHNHKNDGKNSNEIISPLWQLLKNLKKTLANINQEGLLSACLTTTVQQEVNLLHRNLAGYNAEFSFSKGRLIVALESGEWTVQSSQCIKVDDEKAHIIGRNLSSKIEIRLIKDKPKRKQMLKCHEINVSNPEFKLKC